MCLDWRFLSLPLSSSSKGNTRVYIYVCVCVRARGRGIGTMGNETNDERELKAIKAGRIEEGEMRARMCIRDILEKTFSIFPRIVAFRAVSPPSPFSLFPFHSCPRVHYYFQAIYVTEMLLQSRVFIRLSIRRRLKTLKCCFNVSRNSIHIFWTICNTSRIVYNHITRLNQCGWTLIRRKCNFC